MELYLFIFRNFFNFLHRFGHVDYVYLFLGARDQREVTRRNTNIAFEFCALMSDYQYYLLCLKKRKKKTEYKFITVHVSLDVLNDLTNFLFKT